jgi:hypothetical protein
MPGKLTQAALNMRRYLVKRYYSLHVYESVEMVVVEGFVIDGELRIDGLLSVERLS